MEKLYLSTLLEEKKKVSSDNVIIKSILDFSKQEVYGNVSAESKLEHKIGSLHSLSSCSSHLSLCLWWKEGWKTSSKDFSEYFLPIQAVPNTSVKFFENTFTENIDF